MKDTSEPKSKEALLALGKSFGKRLLKSDLSKLGISIEDIVCFFGNISSFNASCGYTISRKSNMTDAEMQNFLKGIASVDSATGCWVTDKIKSNLDGRPQLRYKGKAVLVARIAYKVFKGPLEDALCILHECDNKKCFNPEHLTQGTKQQNVQDMYARNRRRDSIKRITDSHNLTDPYDKEGLLSLVKSRVTISNKNEWLYPHNSELRAYPRIVIKGKTYTLCRLILANKLGKKYEDVDHTCHKFPRNSNYYHDKPLINDVNPDHLYEGTASDNGSDAVYSAVCKLKPDTLEHLFQTLPSIDYSQYESLQEFEQDIAKKLDVSQATIHRLLVGGAHKALQPEMPFSVEDQFLLSSVAAKFNKPVIQMDEKGKHIKRWDSISQIVETENYERNSIRLACNKKIKTYKGFMWEFENDYKLRLLKEEGYLILKNFFAKELVQNILRDAKKIFEQQFINHGYELSDFEANMYRLFREDQECFINCGKHAQHLISLHSLGVHNKLCRQLRELGLTFPSICTRPTMFFNSRHLATKDIYHTMPAHQDIYSTQGSSDSVVVWLPLIDVDRAIGALEIVPKSHTSGVLVSGVEEGFGLVSGFKNEDFRSIELSVGDILIFSAFLVHRSGTNSTESIRWSAHFRYNNLDDSNFIVRKFPHPYIYKPLSKDGQL